MEKTLLIFFAIIAIQMLVAYSKQKKEAQRRNQRDPERIPQEAAPLPDPFKEIREAMGLPPVEEPEESEELEEPEEIEEPILEEVSKNMPFQSITERTLKMDNASLPTQARKLKIHNAIDVNNLEQGIIWTVILQQPRFRTKWKRR